MHCEHEAQRSRAPFSHREKVDAKQPDEGMRRSFLSARCHYGGERQAAAFETAHPHRPASPQFRNLSGGPSLARASKPSARWLEVSAAGADSRAHRGFRLCLGTANDRGRRCSAFGASRKRPRADDQDRSRGLLRDTLHQRRRSWASALGHRGDSPGFRCGEWPANAAVGLSDGLKLASAASPHPSPSATPSPYGRGGIRRQRHV